MTHLLKFVKNSINHWYILLLVGVLFIAVSFYSFFSPAEAFETLALLFGVSFLISGIFEIYFSVANRKEIDNWGWTLIFGLVTLIVGVILINHPGITMLTLSLFVGFSLLFRSIAGISYAIDLKNYGVSDWGYLLIVGILGTIFSIIILWHPGLGGLAITVWIGLAFLFAGIFSVYLSLKLRNLKNLPEKISKELKDKYESIQKEIAQAISK